MLYRTLLRLARWWATVLGGCVLGIGLCLHGQIEVAEHVRQQVAGTFFLWRGIGQLTFAFQGDATQTALWLNDLPQGTLHDCRGAAWVLVVLGSLMVLAAPLWQPRRRCGDRHARR